ncbi:energy transducer TonB [Hymenobacter sp. BT730]|uniref:energy transducer TonB n=1 Tax=Hymenobacter sp. BT730 TaxID=3063332 RepID=UPI0026DFA503|nr:energy transducer TonB [Hymenobacter sp. BT730]
MPIDQFIRQQLLALVLLSGTLALAIQKASAQQVVYDTVRKDKQPIGYSSGMLPMFKEGGAKGFQRFIWQNLKWPAGAERIDVDGRVFIRFTIDSLGHIVQPQVIKSLHPLFDAEAVRVVRLLDSRFTPAKELGRPIAYSMILPIMFRIQEDTKKHRQ